MNDKNVKERKIGVLFVCLGNICRSPAAEGVFRSMIEQYQVANYFRIDSAGLIGAHAGETADSRMKAHAYRRGYDLASISRPLTYDDYFEYDYIIGMDESNRRQLLDRAPTAELQQKVSLLTDWSAKPLLDHVPDPYYGGAEGFELVLDLVESSCRDLLTQVLASHAQATAKPTLCERVTLAKRLFEEKHQLGEFRPQAIFFDMDGVLFDTMPAHDRSWQEATKDRGLKMSSHEVYMAEGQTNRRTINELMQRIWGREATEQEIKEIYERKTELFVQYNTGALIPNVEQVLSRVKHLSPIVVTGSSQPTLLERVEEAFPQMFSRERIISGLDVQYGKPHPEPYLMAAKRANCLPTQAIVVENAPMGVRAGFEANCFVIAVNTGPLPDEVLWREGAHIVVRDMQTLLQVLDLMAV